MEKFNLNKLNMAEYEGQYKVKISNSFAATRNTDHGVSINCYREYQENPVWNCVTVGRKAFETIRSEDARQTTMSEGNKLNSRIKSEHCKTCIYQVCGNKLGEYLKG
jgi:hypothetical protein